MEKVIALATSLPSDSDSLKDLTGKLVQSLWGNLHHPPLSFMGDEYRYRQADGSNNVCHSNIAVSNQMLRCLEYHVPELREGWLSLCSNRHALYADARRSPRRRSGIRR